MAAIIWSDVTAFAPALSTVASGAQTDILAHVNAAIDPDVFDGATGPTYRLARIYLAAHLGTLSATTASGGAAGPVVKETVGAVSREYAGPSGAEAFDALDSTSWGKLYRQLERRSTARGPFVLNGCW